MSSPFRRLVVLSVMSLFAAANAGAQARGSVTMSAYVLPSPVLLSRNLPPSEATGHSITASAEMKAGTVVSKPATSRQPAIEMVGRPREVSRVGNVVELSVIVVVQSNVSYRILVEADASTAKVFVQDAAGQMRSLSTSGTVVAVEAANAGSNRQAEIRYRVDSATAGQDMLPMRLTLQTSAML